MPAIAAPHEPVVRCARCQTQLSSGVAATEPPEETTEPVVDQASSLASPPAALPITLDDLELEEDLRRAHQAATALGVATEDDSSYLSDLQPAVRQKKRRSRRKRPAPQRSQAASLLAWFVMGTGLTCLAFGSVLLGWSYATGRGELWTLGMPFAIGGQVALIFGILLQLDRRTAVEPVDEHEDAEDELDEIRRAAALLMSQHDQTRRIDPAEPISSNLSLAALKRELDELTHRLAE